MTAEQLLKPRFKVISDYPESPFEIDEIIDGNILDKMNGRSALISGKALIKLDHVIPTNKRP